MLLNPASLQVAGARTQGQKTKYMKISAKVIRSKKMDVGNGQKNTLIMVVMLDLGEFKVPERGF